MRKNTKGTIIFRTAYGIITFLLAAVIAFVLFFLWNGLKAYEKSTPEIPMDKLISELTDNKNSLINKLDFKLNEFENISSVERYFERLTEGDISYSRNGKESDDHKTVYNIKANEGVIAQAVVTASGKDLGYGFKEYELTHITFGDIPTSEYSVTAPSNALLFCNGKEVSDMYVTETGTPYAETEHFQGLIENPPCNFTFTVNGFIEEPVFTAEDLLGHQLVLSDKKFSLAKEEDEEVSQLALEFSKAYSKYIVNDGKLSAVEEYLAPAMPLYDELYGYENFWHNRHSDYDFLDITTEPPLFYSDKAACVRVRYDHVLYGVNSSENGELHSPADYTIYMVCIEGNWKVTDLELN